jgi:hypothetical protein
LGFTELTLERDTTFDDAFGVDDADVDGDVDPSDYADDRHLPGWSTKSGADIHPHEEVFDNYLPYGGVSKWSMYLNELNMFCSGGSGIVSRYEQGRNVLPSNVEKTS